jgi:type IX secretion system substrate protein
MKKNLTSTLAKLFLLFMALISNYVLGQSQGPDSPASASYSVIGCLSCPGAEWSNWNNIMTADGIYADVSLNAFPNCFQTSCYYSRYLIASNFGFTVPASATISGVKAEIIRLSSASPNGKDTIVEIFTPGNFGTNHASSLLWTPSTTVITYGDSTDVWGLTLTPDSVNDVSFGFRIMIRNGSPVITSAPSSVDHVQMTVYYSLPTGTFSQTRIVNDITLFPNPATNQFTIYDLRFTISNIEVYNMLGEKIFSEPVTRNQQPVTVNVSALTPGIYFAVIDTGKEKIKRKFLRSEY